MAVGAFQKRIFLAYGDQRDEIKADILFRNYFIKFSVPPAVGTYFAYPHSAGLFLIFPACSEYYKHFYHPSGPIIK